MTKLGVVASIPIAPEVKRGRPPKSGPPTEMPRPNVPVFAPTTRRLPNWLLAYQEYTSDMESPDVFHAWAGLSAIAAVTVRQIYIPFAYGNVYTNLFVGFVGRPATKKSTAIKLAYKLAKKVVPQHMLPSAGSAAAIIASLADMKDLPTQAGNIQSDELGSLIRSGDTDIVNTLTDLYDCAEDIYKRTIGRGKETLAKPWLNMIFGTTPQWLGANMAPSMADGGFFSRIIFVHCDEIKFTSPRPMENEDRSKLREDLVNDLIHIHSIKGEVTFSQEAGEYYDKWYRDETRITNGDPRTEGYLVRKATHVVKVAMLLMLAERDALVLEQRDIEVALTLLASIEKGISVAVGSVGRNELLTHSQSILRHIQSGGKNGISYKELLRKHIHNVNPREMAEILTALTSTGDVRRVVQEGGVQRYFYMIQR